MKVSVQEIKKKQILLMVKLYYERLDKLHDRELTQLQEDALEKYLDTDFSIDEINDLIAKDYLQNTVSKDEKKAKMLVKVRQDNEDGYIHNMIITSLTLITFSLCFIGLIIIYLLKL